MQKNNIIVSWSHGLHAITSAILHASCPACQCCLSMKKCTTKTYALSFSRMVV